MNINLNCNLTALKAHIALAQMVTKSQIIIPPFVMVSNL